MSGFSTNIESRSLENNYFRQVLYTAPHCQLVVMTLMPGEDIGLETHADGDQFIRVESGRGEALLDGIRHELLPGTALVIPEGTQHNIINTAREPLRLYTLYSPPEHAEGTIHRTRAEAVAAHVGH